MVALARRENWVVMATGLTAYEAEQVEAVIHEKAGWSLTVRYPDSCEPTPTPGVSGRTAAWAILASLTALALLADLAILLWG